jgi:hypothetical protein
MAFRKVERTPFGPVRNNNVRIAHTTPGGPLITIPREVAKAAGIVGGERVDLMIDTEQVSPKIAIVSGGDDVKANSQRETGPIIVIAGRLRQFVPRMKTTPALHEIGDVDGRKAVIITVPEAEKAKRA